MNPRIIILAFGVAVGYVLGAREGRERYDLMKAKATQLWEDPRVAKARRDVEAYARTQAPIIRERAEAAAKAAPGVAKDVAGKVADTAKDVASNVADTAKDVASNVADTAKDVASNVADTAKDVADRVVDTTRDVAGKTASTAKDVADKTSATAKDVRDQAGKVAADIRERGETAGATAVVTAGEARDAALDVLDDADDAPKA